MNHPTGVVIAAILLASWAIIAVGGAPQGPAAAPGSAAGEIQSAITNTLQFVSWEPGPPLVTARSNPGVLVAGGYLYAIGGDTDTGATTDVERSQIQADGTLGAWSRDGRSLPVAVENPSAALYDGFVYYVGLHASDASTLVVESAAVTGGGIGDWTVTNSPLRDAAYPYAVATSGYLYVFYLDKSVLVGGVPGAGAERAPINPDGTLGPLVDLGSLAGTPASVSAVAFGNWVYLVGSGKLCAGNVYRTAVGSDGTLAPFQPMSSAFSVMVERATALGQTIYAAGSPCYAANGPYVQRVTVMPDGTLSTSETLPYPRNLLGGAAPPGLAASGASLYMLGGTSVTPFNAVTGATERLWLAPYGLALPLIVKGNTAVTQN